MLCLTRKAAIQSGLWQQERGLEGEWVGLRETSECTVSEASQFRMSCSGHGAWGGVEVGGPVHLSSPRTLLSSALKVPCPGNPASGDYGPIGHPPWRMRTPLRSRRVGVWSWEAAGLTDHSCGHRVIFCHTPCVTPWACFLISERELFVALNSRNNNYAKNGKYFQEWEHWSVAPSALSC